MSAINKKNNNYLKEEYENKCCFKCEEFNKIEDF